MGTVATASLQKLDDGQNDSVAMLRRRETAEASGAAVAMGRPEWDASTFAYVPSSLKGLKPVTPEPWAIDSDKYVHGMAKHGVVSRATDQCTDRGYEARDLA